LRNSLILIIFLSAINLFLWLYYLPTKEKALAIATSDYKAVREKRAKERILTFKDVFENKEKIGEIEKKLRSREDFSKIITYIFDKTFPGKVEIKSINYAFEEKKDLKLTKLTLNINLEGNYSGIKRYIYDLESGSHSIIIDSLKVQKAAEMLNANLTLTTYLKGTM